MFNSNNATLPVSIPLGIGNYNGGFGGFSGNGFDDIIALAIVAMIFGWGNGGYGFGGFGGGASGVASNYVLSSDFATIQRQLSDGFGATESKLDSISNGICSLGYDQLAQMNGINTNILTTGFGIQNAVQADTIANMQNTNALQSQISQCCCDNKQLLMQAEYNAQARNCAELQAIDKVGDRIIDYLSSEKISALSSENQALKTQNYIRDVVKPPINPCYVTNNPYCGCGQASVYGYGYPYGTTIA